MWQQEKKDSAIVSLALLLSLATSPMAVHLFVPTPVLAQSATDADSFPLPTSVEDGTTVRIDGSMNLAAINQSLKQGFEQEFSGANVEVASNGADVAISALIDGTVDLVAIARGLTPDEQAQGLVQLPFQRENIAIIVSTDNPFQGGLTDQQFADIFRGKITDWSEIGASEGTIRFIDRPETSDTRNTFRTYPAFTGAEFATGSNATQIEEDNTAEIVKQLGNDGISYAMAHQVSQLSNVRVIPINDILPDNPNYPYSQPLVYAYRQNPSPNVANFLGFTLAVPGQQAIETGRAAAAAAIAQGEVQTAPANTQTVSEEQQSPETNLEDIPLWWLLLPISVIVVLLMWLIRSRIWATEAQNKTTDANLKESMENEVAIDNISIDTPVSEPFPEMPSNDDALTAGAVAAMGEHLEEKSPLKTNDESNSTETESFDNPDSLWDIEAPAAVVNTPYPQLPDVPQVVSEELPLSEVVSEAENSEIKDFGDEIAEQPQVEPDLGLIEDIFSTETTDLAGNMATADNLWSENDDDIFATETTDLGGDIAPEYNVSSQHDDDDDTMVFSNCDETILPPSDEKISENVVISHPSLPDITEDILNVVADAAEPGNNLSEEIDIFADSATFEGTGLENEREVLSDITEPTWFDVDGEQSLVLKYRNAEWAYATWFIGESCQQALENNGISQLALRLYDVTDLDLSYQTPQFVEEYEIDSGIELYVAIPHSDHDYIAEIGYVTEGDRWVIITRSQRIRVFATPVEDTTEDPVNLDGEQSIVLKPRNSEWAYASWYISETCQQALANNGISQLALRLYDVTDLDLSYQTSQFVEEYEIESGIELYVAIPHSDHDYIAEIGYVTEGDRWITITRSDRVRVFDTASPEDTTEAPVINLDGEQSIVVKPRNPEWAYATWYISESCQQTLANHDISQLALRLYDVTDLDLSYQTPQFVEKYEIESGIEAYVAIPDSDHDYIAEIGYVTEGDRWITITRSDRVRVFDTPLKDTTEDPVLNLDGEQSIVLQPQNAEWAAASWSISETYQQTLANNGISQLVVRLYDVTDLDLSYQTPELGQEYKLESGIEKKYLAIPQSDRDYIAEIGYVTDSDIWVTIARSARVRIFGIPLTNTTDDNISTADTELVDLSTTQNESSILLKTRTPKWAYATWYISTTDKQMLQSNSRSQLYLRLYDVTDLDLSYHTPQLVQKYECDEITSDRYVAIPATDHDYIAEIGYLTAGDRWEMIVRSEKIRVFSRPQPDFWFVADAELIIHGSTEPGATVNIAGKPITLKADGTFHLRVPFSDDSIDYLMTAIAANEEHSTTIRKKFSQENSDS
ncbi:DUF4912 domain-containing protein [Anabaena sp. CCY 0017]|uniref:DUF4912 domain-containing protein n=1 Tax=Anabaena sp. CCY 0017 TaxID=3103866 RepID=UPI0039C76026